MVRDALGMLTAISFNNHTALLADEVDYERTDRLLAAELGAIELALAQVRRQFSFRISQFST